jgi:16S rRNA (cytosine967-C5)-methyltransferase
LVNAILRRIAHEGGHLIGAQAAARLNTPDWLWQSWQSAYGDATCQAIAAAHLEEPPLDITVKEPATSEYWAERLEAKLLPTGTLRRQSGGLVTALPGYDDGAWWIQDAAAALPVRLMGDVAGKSVIDLAAAPGGKAAQLANADARVTAVDISAKRLSRLSANLGRLGLTAEIVTADAGTWRPAEPADAVLLDVPCTATGTIRRHPDVAHLKRPADVIRLAELQDRLLRAAIEMVAQGGMLLYCSCSLQPEEGSERVAALLAEDAPLARAPIAAAELDGRAELITEHGDLRTLPSNFSEFGGMDGFYAARLRRI